MPDIKHLVSTSESSHRIARACDEALHWIVYVLAAAVPAFFLPWTNDVLELNKQMLILAGAVGATLCWLGKSLAQRRFEYRRSIANVFVALFFAAYAVSTWLSTDRYMSLVGDFGQQKSGLMTVAAFVLLYYVVTANFLETSELRRLLYATVLGGLISGAFAMLQGLGVYLLPFDFSETSSFNSIGTATGLGVYQVFVFAICAGLLLVDRGDGRRTRGPGPLANLMLVTSSVIALLLICVIDYWPVSVSLFVSSALLAAFALMHAKSVRGMSGIVLPVVGVGLALVLLAIRFPVTVGFPSEVMPSFKASALITVQALREDPLFGSGPGTFVFDYAKHRAQEVNSSQFWNIRFDRGASRALTSLATTGLIGTLAWALVAFYLAYSAGRKLLRADESTWHLLIGVFAAWSALLAARFTYSSSITLEFAFWMMLAALVVSHRQDFASYKLDRSPRAALVIVFLFIFGSIMTLAGLFTEGTRYGAEVVYASAVRMNDEEGKAEDAIARFEKAVGLNPRNDAYLRTLALARKAQVEAAVGTSAAVVRAEGEDDVTYAGRQRKASQELLTKASELASGAVAAARAATEVSGHNVANWAVLATIHQAFIGLTTEDEPAAIKAYEKAVELEPANPEHHVKLGEIYIFRSEMVRQSVASGAAAELAEKAAEDAEEALGLAIAELEKAIELKSDYAPAHYQLALVLDRQGKLKDAIAKMERAIVLGPQDSGARFELALLYYRDGRKDDARALLETVVQSAPDFSNARWYLASIYEELGDVAAATAQIEEVAKRNPDNELVKQKQADLAAMKTGTGDGLPEPVEE